MNTKSPVIRIIAVVLVAAGSLAVYRVYDEIRFQRDAEATRVAGIGKHKNDEFVTLDNLTPRFIRQKIDAGKGADSLNGLMRGRLQSKVSEMIAAYGEGDFSAYLRYRYGPGDVGKLLAQERISPMIEFLPPVTTAASDLRKLGVIGEERDLDYSNAEDVVMAWWHFVAPKTLNDHGESYFCIGCWNGVSVDSFDFAFETLPNRNRLQASIQKNWPSKYYMGVGPMFTNPVEESEKDAGGSMLVAMCRLVPRMDRRQTTCPMIITFVFDSQTGDWVPDKLSLQLNTTSVWYVF